MFPNDEDLTPEGVKPPECGALIGTLHPKHYALAKTALFLAGDDSSDDSCSQMAKGCADIVGGMENCKKIVAVWEDMDALGKKQNGPQAELLHIVVYEGGIVVCGDKHSSLKKAESAPGKPQPTFKSRINSSNN